jgi:hypothetical protein
VQSATMWPYSGELAESSLISQHRPHLPATVETICSFKGERSG